MRVRYRVSLRLLAPMVLVVMLAACQPAMPPPTAAWISPVVYEDLARHYAPVIYQGAASDQDYITRLDFDGDWIGNNNWENQPTGDLSAYVYYSVIESETHWFLFYSLYHPRDYTPEPCEQSNGCHENDMESIQLVVRKDGTRYGRLEAMETLAHNRIYLFVADPAVTKGFLDVSGRVRFEGDHPIVYVETYGHGIYGYGIPMVPGRVIYRVGDRAQRPRHINDEVTYQLLPIYETLWARRGDMGDGRTFDRPFFYGPNLIPAAIDGDTYGVDKANTPWGYNQARGMKLHRGDWFLDPAKALAFHATFPEPFSRRYIFNPYLADLNLLSPEGESLRGKPTSPK